MNNALPSDEARLVEMKKKYLIFGREKAPMTGTPHLQGYVVWTEGKSLSSAKQAIGPRAHVEIAKGSAGQNREYCIKDGDFVEVGTVPGDARSGGAAEKARWEDARKLARTGKVEDVPADIYVRYYRTLKEIAKDHVVPPPDADGVTGLWFYGPAGCGKSRDARSRYPNSYLKLCNKWWDGY